MEAMTSLVEVAPMVVEEVKNLAVITIANLTEMEVDPVIVILTIAMFKLQVSLNFRAKSHHLLLNHFFSFGS